MQGRLIVMEGIDGSGKSTQYELLNRRLEREGRVFRTVKFPRYDRESSALIRAYLAGDYGSAPGDVNPYAAATFYAVDRFDSYRRDWGGFYREGGLVLCDRWTTSNACHQGSKLPPEERGKYLDWLAGFEYGLLGLPAPDRVIYLDLPLELSLRQLARRGNEADIHERDREYLAACQEAGRFAAEHYGWTRVCCAEHGAMRSREELHEEIYREILDIL
ncbi:MAG: thymidylate kinase [Oscillospiraceae bacterium]|nr:thymidylate kinase [Oscillospiraceae bacterium]